MSDTVASEPKLFSNPEDERAYEEFCATQQAVPAFELDRPALVCRWRMSKRQVPMLNRHVRALSQRVVQGRPLTTNMLSWAKQHVEWSLSEGTYDDPDGVLMLVIDVNGNAAMTVGAYEPLADTSRAALMARAVEAASEQAETGVAPEVLCRIENGVLHVGAAEDEHVCGAMTLIEQLCATRGHDVVRAGSLAGTDAAAADDLTGTVLLVSDEHGVVCEDGADEHAVSEDVDLANFLAQGLARLFS